MQRSKYKQPLTIDEQIEYLKSIKHVVFIKISEEKAKNILYENNYINVITPYKHFFAMTDITGKVIRDAQEKHIYPFGRVPHQTNGSDVGECHLQAF